MATTLTTNYQQIYSLEGASDGYRKWYLRLYLKYNSQSITDNTSVVGWDVRVGVGTAGGGYGYNNNSYNFSCTINGTSVLNRSIAVGRVNDGSEVSIASGTTTVTHSADGSFTNRGVSLSGTAYTSSVSSNSASINLPTIPRASEPTLNAAGTSQPNFTLGDTITIYTNRKSTAFTHTVQLKYGSNTVTIGTAKAVGDSVTYNTANIQSAVYALIPNAKTYSNTITVTTYNGDTQIGSAQTITYYANVPDSSKPTISGYTISEVGSALSGKGVSGTEVVQTLSTKRITVTVSALNGASVSSVTCQNGSKSYTMSLSSGKYTCDFAAPPTATFNITAIDSRGLSNSLPQTGTFKAYEKPSVQTYNLTRTSATASTGTLAATGTFWNGTAGSTTNAVTIQFQLKGESSWTTSAGSRSGGTWSISQSMSGLNYNQAFVYNVRATDSFGQTANVTVNLPISTAVLQLTDNTVICNDYLIAKTNIGIRSSDTGSISITMTGLNSSINTINSTIGTGSLTTTSQTLKGAINELNNNLAHTTDVIFGYNAAPENTLSTTTNATIGEATVSNVKAGTYLILVGGNLFNTTQTGQLWVTVRNGSSSGTVISDQNIAVSNSNNGNFYTIGARLLTIPNDLSTAYIRFYLKAQSSSTTAYLQGYKQRVCVIFKVNVASGSSASTGFSG